MRSKSVTSGLAVVAMAAALGACQQQTEKTPSGDAAPAADVNVNPPDNITVNPPDVTPDVNINPPNVNINPPDVDVSPADRPSSKETTTVTVPGVGSTTTTTEKR